MIAQRNLKTENDNQYVPLHEDLIQENQLHLELAIEQLDTILGNPQRNDYHEKGVQLLTVAEKQYEKLILNYMHLDKKKQDAWQHKIRILSIKIKNRENKIRQNQKKEDILSQTVWEVIQAQRSQIRYKCKGIMGIIGSFLIHLLIGCSFRWNIINAYITSYYKLGDDNHLTINGDIICSTLSMAAIGITMRLGVILSRCMGVLPVCLLSVMMMTVTVFVSSYMPTIWLFVLFNVIIYGLFAGLLYSAPMEECLKFFPNSRIYVNTLIQVGTALGTVMFGVQNTICMNPSFRYPYQTGYFIGSDLTKIALKMPRCINFMSIWVLVVGFIGTFFLSLIVQNNKEKEQFQKDVGLSDQFAKDCKTHKQALTSRVFWVMALILLLCSCGNYFVLSNFKALISKHFPDQKIMDLVILIGLLCNALFRLGWGLSFKKLGFKITFMMAMLLNIFIFFTIQAAAYSPPVYILIFGLSCGVLGGLIVIFINLNMLVFGKIIGDETFPYFWMLFCLSNFLNFLFCDYLVSTIQYFGVLVMCSIFAVIALIITIEFQFKGSWANQTIFIQGQVITIK